MDITMTPAQHASANPEAAFRGYIRQTRKYGSTYVHVANQRYTWSYPLEVSVGGRDVHMWWASYGRSVQNGGHAHKAYANYVDTGKPVPSKCL